MKTESPSARRPSLEDRRLAGPASAKPSPAGGIAPPSPLPIRARGPLARRILTLFRLFDDRPEEMRARLLGIYALLISANVAAWAWAWAEFGDRPVLLGTALLAYVFGVRHAVDADHIAAIDNVVRKLMQEGKRPLSVGFFFSLGHSSLVLIAAMAISATAAALQGRFQHFKAIGGIIGTLLSAGFLLAIGLINLVVLVGVWRQFRRARRGVRVSDEALDLLLSGRGLLARMFGPLFRAIRRSWHMYPLGFLFGLGFDTATEIALLGLAAAQAAEGLSLRAIAVLPALFAAGMTLVDTTDSVLMVRAYGWAFINPIRKLWYNLTITGVSVVVALVIGGIEALGLVASRLELSGAFWRAIQALNQDLGGLGLVMVGVFLATWAVSAAVYRWQRLDEVTVRVETPEGR